MSMVETKCPHCHAGLQIQEEWIGMDVECPECKREFKIRKDPMAAAPVQTNSGGTFTFVCPSCNTAAELPNSLLGQQYECRRCFETTIAQAASEKQCPYCGQTVKLHAKICKFCKADLTKAPPPAAAPKQEETFIFICPECGEVEFLPVSMKGREHECRKCCEPSIAEPAEERKCPHCGEKIKIKAAICKHCKKAVDPLTAEAQPAEQFSGSSSKGSSLIPSGEKTAAKTLLWSLLWPGAGQIYLGQTSKGNVLILGYTLVVAGMTALQLPLISRLLDLMLTGYIFGDALGILTRLQLGEPVGKWDFCAPGNGKRLRLPPDKQVSLRYASFFLIICVLLGLTGPGIVSLVMLIACSTI